MLSPLLLIPSAINSYRRNNILWTVSNNLIVVTSLLTHGLNHISPFIEIDRITIYLIGLSYVKSPVLILAIPFVKDLRTLAQLSFTCGVTKSIVDSYQTKYFDILIVVWTIAVMSFVYLKCVWLWHLSVGIGLFISSYKADASYNRRSRGKYSIRY